MTLKVRMRGDQVFRDTMDDIDDIEYANIPMDWEPNVDLLESFEPNYLENKNLILILTFLRGDEMDLREININKRIIEELTGAKVTRKSKGYAKELYDNLKFDRDSEGILYKDVRIFTRDVTNNNLVLVKARLHGRFLLRF